MPTGSNPTAGVDWEVGVAVSLVEGVDIGRGELLMELAVLAPMIDDWDVGIIEDESRIVELATFMLEEERTSAPGINPPVVGITLGPCIVALFT